MKIKITLNSDVSKEFEISCCYYEPKLKHLSFLEKGATEAITISMYAIKRFYINEQ